VILTPFVGVFVGAGPPSGDSPGLIASAPARISLRSLAAGLALRLRPPFHPATMTVRLLAGRRTLAHLVRTVRGGAALAVRLRLSAGTQRRLPARRLEIDVTARSAQDPPVSARRIVVIHP
jgi:hypothetical protein